VNIKRRKNLFIGGGFLDKNKNSAHFINKIQSLVLTILNGLPNNDMDDSIISLDTKEPNSSKPKRPAMNKIVSWRNRNVSLKNEARVV